MKEMAECIITIPPFSNKLWGADLEKKKKKNLTQLQLIAPFIYPIKSRILIQEVYFLFWFLILLIRTKM